jgi:hypothetical protein
VDSYDRLKAAVIERLGGEESLEDVANYGAGSGFPGFTYYTDTVKFYDEFSDEIWELLVEDARSLGCGSVLEMIAGFGGAGGCESDTTFKNLLAWYALEAVAQREVNA